MFIDEKLEELKILLEKRPWDTKEALRLVSEIKDELEDVYLQHKDDMERWSA